MPCMGSARTFSYVLALPALVQPDRFQLAVVDRYDSVFWSGGGACDQDRIDRSYVLQQDDVAAIARRVGESSIVKRLRNSLLIVATGFAILAPAVPASAIEDCFFMMTWRADDDPCGNGQYQYRPYVVQVYECLSGNSRQFDLGPPTSSTDTTIGCRVPVNLAEGYVDHSGE